MNFIHLIRKKFFVICELIFITNVAYCTYITIGVKSKKEKCSFIQVQDWNCIMSSQRKATENSGPTKRRICIYILHLTYFKEACLAKPVYSHSHDRGQTDLPTVSEDLRSSEQLHRACQVTGFYIRATTSSMSGNRCLHGATSLSMLGNRCLHRSNYTEHVR